MSDADFLKPLSSEERAILDAFHFDLPGFLTLRERFLNGKLNQNTNRLTAQVSAPHPEELRSLAAPESPEGKRLAELGREALAQGQVGALILNGGMATRFGGVVKGTVEVFDQLSFLGLKLLEARRHGPNVPVLLMNSFATHEKTAEHLQQHNYFGFNPDNLLSFCQNVSIRLTHDGDIFQSKDGTTSLYAPGHGDLPEAITRSGALDAFQSRGGKYLLMSNVDNALAMLDPVVIGMHIDAQQHGIEMTIETVEKYSGDSGGMPARVNGHLQVVEAFRFPSNFDLDSIPVFNTNTFLFNADALQRDYDLSWFVVEKMIAAQPAIQFERLAGELSASMKAEFLVVPRSGAHSRFLPIKTREDLEQHRDYLKARAAAW